MKTVVASIVTAVAASACCLGPVLFSIVGAGAFGAASVRLGSFRPIFLGLTGVLLAAGFFVTYGRAASTVCGPDGACAPSTNRGAKLVLWMATIAVILLVMFPYYISWWI